MNTLSVVMIVKNEEAMLGACLESVKEADEIIILDTGSKDKTKEVALKYTDKFFENEYVWCDNFADARNAAKAKATGDWILSIDADETLEKNGIARVREAIETDKRVIEINMVCGINTYHVPRLFRNSPAIVWKGAIHETLNIVEPNKSDIKITYGTSPAHALDPNRSLRILRKEVDANPKAVREVYYLAREYTYKKEWEKAIYWFNVYVSRSKWKPEKADGFYLLAKSYWNMNRGEEARKACLQALSINANFKAAGKLMAQMSWPKNAKRWLEWAEGATDEDVLFTRGGVAPKPMPKKPIKDFLILGHPRCGTKYMSELFTTLGLPVGHECFKKSGIASWLYAVDDVNGPRYVTNKQDKKDFNYRHIIHVVRDPLKAIASIMLTEDIGKESLDFRRKYVTLFGNAYEVATLSYLSWNKLIQSHSPALTVKVEEADTEVIAFLEKHNYLSKSLLENIPPLPSKNVNARPHRGMDMDELTNNLPGELINTLSDFAEEHGYDL